MIIDYGYKSDIVKTWLFVWNFTEWSSLLSDISDDQLAAQVSYEHSWSRSRSAWSKCLQRNCLRRRRRKVAKSRTAAANQRWFHDVSHFSIFFLHTYTVWHIFSYIYHKNQPNVGKYIRMVWDRWAWPRMQVFLVRSTVIVRPAGFSGIRERKLCFHGGEMWLWVSLRKKKWSCGRWRAGEYLRGPKKKDDPLAAIDVPQKLSKPEHHTTFL